MRTGIALFLMTLLGGVQADADPGRRAEQPACQACARGYEKSGLLCYKPCNRGYSGVGPVCWQNCPSGFKNHGAFCGKPGPYGRGGGYAWKFGDPLNLSKAKKRCERKHGRGRCEKSGLLYYPKCKTGFHAVGCCICSPNCPSGMRDIGVSCTKRSYGRGVGRPLRQVEQAFGKAADWLRKAVRDAGKNLKSLGKKILDGLKTVGKGIAKGILYGPFLAYIAGHHAPPWTTGAKPLTRKEKDYLKKYYPMRLLNKVRVRELANWTGFFNFGAGATTYGNDFIIIKRGHRSNTLLKHEMVHICQYDKYGIAGFSKRYADQFVDTGDYNKMPFEDQAYRFAGGGQKRYPGMEKHISKFLGYCSR